MKIKKAVIAAAGLGTRFLPVTKAYPKELVPILDKPNIQLLVEELIGAGIEQIVIVHRPGDTLIKKYFTPDKKLERTLKAAGKESYLASLYLIWQKIKVFKFIPQPPDLPYGNASPVLAAKDFINLEPFVYLFGDDLILEKKPGTYLQYLLNIFQKYQPAVILGCQKVSKEEISRVASIKYWQDKKYPFRASAVLEKLPAEKAPSLIGQFGRFVVAPKIFKVLSQQDLGLGGELWFADTVNYLAKNDIVLAVPIKNGCWMTTGDPSRWLKANLAWENMLKLKQS